MLKRTKPFQKCFFWETIWNANTLETRDLIAWNSEHLPKRDRPKNNCYSFLSFPARRTRKTHLQALSKTLDFLFLRRVDTKLQTVLELQPVMILRPNIFAADQNNLKHFLQIHRFLGDVYTIKIESAQISKRMYTWAWTAA